MSQVRVVTYLEEAAAERLRGLAASDQRTTSAMARVLLERALGGEEPQADGLVGVAPRGGHGRAEGRNVSVSSPPSGLEGEAHGNTDGPPIGVVSSGRRASPSSPPVSVQGRAVRPAGSACSFDTPHGVKCKMCGKVH